MLVWLNGKLQDVSEARIAPQDRGFTLGDGLFETLRVASGVVLHLERHLARLAAGAAVLRLAVDESLVRRAVSELLAAVQPDSAALRLTLSRGEGPRGLLPPPEARLTMLATLAPLSAPLGAASIIVARSTRRNELSPLSGIKSLNMLDNLLARLEAQAVGADDALLLNSRGQVTESSIANILVQRGTELLTPPLADGVLPGITRALLLERLPVREVSLTESDLAQAEGILLTNSLGLRAVAQLEGRSLVSTPLLERCQAALR